MKASLICTFLLLATATRIQKANGADAPWEVLKTVISLFPVILVWKIMGKYLKAVTNVKPVIFLQTTQISKTCYSLLKTCYSLS